MISIKTESFCSSAVIAMQTAVLLLNYAVKTTMMFEKKH